MSTNPSPLPGALADTTPAANKPAARPTAAARPGRPLALRLKKELMGPPVECDPSIDQHFVAAARVARSAEHAFGIETEREMALRVDRDHAAFAVRRGQFLLHDFVDRLLEAHLAVFHERVDVV